jgi:hypothetical protein
MMLKRALETVFFAVVIFMLSYGAMGQSLGSINIAQANCSTNNAVAAMSGGTNKPAGETGMCFATEADFYFGVADGNGAEPNASYW